MHLPTILPFLTALAAATTSALQTSLTLTLPTNAQLPQPWTLPPQTHATLSSSQALLRAAITPANTFVFRNVSAGSYLVDVHCATHAFVPLRVDVGEGGDLEAWETYRGNDWGNKGEGIALREGAGGRGFEVRVLGGKNYFVERPKFSVFTILKNPMILLGLVSMGLFIGMPYLVDNMDPEMRAEFEERQKSNPMNGLISGQQAAANPIGNFDMAAYLAGSNKEGGGKKDKGGKK